MLLLHNDWVSFATLLVLFLANIFVDECAAHFSSSKVLDSRIHHMLNSTNQQNGTFEQQDWSGVESAVEVNPVQLTLAIGTTAHINFFYSNLTDTDLVLNLDHLSNLRLTPSNVTLLPNKTVSVAVTGVDLISRTFIDVSKCSSFVNQTSRDCPFDKNDLFVRVTVIKSPIISWLVIVSGWVYFVAWSISFYPQMILNFQRKSVVGLNFDFLVLNVLGFFCYTVYNTLLYFDLNVQEIYLTVHGHRSLIPVLLNDVIFSAHAFIASCFTAFQCLIYERGAQRISYVCRCWASFLAVFSFVTFVCSMFEAINLLQFITYLAYVKMAVTLSKYFPQAILNFRRKSTTGWSIGNVLLDFTGGSMDIFQMIMQASNTADWSAFYGNPVKFGLGLISMLFDILFIIQHYVLYREKSTSSYTDGESDQTNGAGSNGEELPALFQSTAALFPTNAVQQQQRESKQRANGTETSAAVY